MSCLLNN